MHHLTYPGHLWRSVLCQHFSSLSRKRGQSTCTHSTGGESKGRKGEEEKRGREGKKDEGRKGGGETDRVRERERQRERKEFSLMSYTHHTMLRATLHPM